jgi:DNA polymerase-3 subunit gamma/tau
MDQFIAAAPMVGLDDLFRFYQLKHAAATQSFIDCLAPSQVGVEHRIRSGKLQQILPVFTQGAAEYGPAKHLPTFPTVTEFHKVPATIISRCQHFEFKKISQKDIINHLLDITKQENITISSYGLNMIAEAADGSLRDAQSLLDKAVSYSGEHISDEDLKEILGAISREVLFNFSSAVLDEEPGLSFPLVESVIEKGYDLRFFYKELIQHFRNLLLVKTATNPQELLALSEEDLQALAKEAEKASHDDFLRYLVALQQGEPGLKFSSHPRIYLEALLVKLCHFKKIVPLEDIIHDIEALKKGFKMPGDSVAEYKGEEKPHRPKTQILDKAPAGKEEAELPPPSPEIPQEKMKGPMPDTAPKSISKDKDAAAKDPTVKYFLDTFKAQVLTVEPLKKGKKERK